MSLVSTFLMVAVIASLANERRGFLTNFRIAPRGPFSMLKISTILFK